MSRAVSPLRPLVLLALCLALALPAGPALADDSVHVSVRGGTAVFTTSETWSREGNGSATSVRPNEYLSFYVTVRNTGVRDCAYRNAYFRVDGGQGLYWANFALKAGEEKTCHIWRDNMSRVLPGVHTVTFYLNDQLVYTENLYLARDWRTIITYPTGAQVRAARNSGRSPYIVYYPQFQGTEILTEYAIDFSVDDMSDGTYFATMDATMGTSSLAKKYRKLSNDYNVPGGFYCGFQRWENGRTGVIMSVWDVFCEDKSGRRSIICADQLYPTYRAGVSKTSGEGSFQQFIIEYPWYPCHPYRMLMQCYPLDNGNTGMTMWVCDLLTEEWTKLVSWDLGYASAGIRTGDLGGFMENYLVEYAGSVRNVSMSNIRGLSARTQRWVAADAVVFTVNNSMTPMHYVGTYSFGSDDASYWIVTSGVPGLCAQPKSGSRYTVRNASADSPY